MRYADTYCVVTEEYTPKHVYIYTGPCVLSGKLVTVRIPAEELHAYRRGLMIQDAMPSLKADEREFLLSGMSSESFDSLFGSGATQPDDSPDSDSTTPDYSMTCEVCGETPVVPLTGLCGPCTFGEADTAGGNW